MAVTKPMAVVKEVVGEVVAEGKRVAVPVAEVEKPVVQAERPVAPKAMMMPERPMVPMDPEPVMMMGRMTESEREPYRGRR